MAHTVNEKKRAILGISGSNKCLEEETKGINPGTYRLLFSHLAIALHKLRVKLYPNHCA